MNEIQPRLHLQYTGRPEPGSTGAAAGRVVVFDSAMRGARAEQRWRQALTMTALRQIADSAHSGRQQYRRFLPVCTGAAFCSDFCAAKIPNCRYAERMKVVRCDLLGIDFFLPGRRRWVRASPGGAGGAVRM